MHFDLQRLPPRFPSRGVCLGGARLGNRTLKRAETRICRMSQNEAGGDARQEDARVLAHAAAARLPESHHRRRVTTLRAEPGKDIWLFGGDLMFRSLLDAGLVDAVEVAVMPALLGGGIPRFPPPPKQAKLKLTGHNV